MTAQDEALPRPNRRAVWRWVATSSRPYVGWALAVLGAVSLFLGWWGVSGQSLTSKQLPYLVSGGLTGVGLVILSAVFLATDDLRRQLSRIDEMERKVDDLYSLLVVEPAPQTAAASTSAPTSTATLVALPTGSSYHRPSCALVARKANASPVDARAVKSRSLRPCRVCEPPAGKSG